MSLRPLKNVFEMIRTIFLINYIILISISFVSCEKNYNPIPSNDNENKLENLIAFNDFEFDVNNFHVFIDSTGQLHDATLYNIIEPVFGANQIYVIFSAGLWLGTFSNAEPKANIVWVGSGNSRSNYTTKWPDRKLGVHFADPSIISMPNINWPIDDGFPVDEQNNPIHYGDAMCWSVLRSDSTQTENVLSQPVPNVKIVNTLYGYSREDLKNTIFLNYDISTLKLASFDEMYCGFYSDSDFISTGNKTGYDSDRGISYTYNPSDTGKTYISAFAFLRIPFAGPSHFGVTSHRIMRKNFDPNFGEKNFNTAQQVIYALQGLDNAGQAMVNPITGEITKYAFTGDPVTGTGWLDDIPSDVRNLISSGPFSIEANQNKKITVVWVVEFGNNLADALQAVKNKIDAIRNEPNLWNF